MNIASNRQDCGVIPAGGGISKTIVPANKTGTHLGAERRYQGLGATAVCSLDVSTTGCAAASILT
jgi:hypothetical protein